MFLRTYIQGKCIHGRLCIRKTVARGSARLETRCVFSYLIYSSYEQERFHKALHMLNTFVQYHAVNNVPLSRNHLLVSRLNKKRKKEKERE